MLDSIFEPLDGTERAFLKQRHFRLCYTPRDLLQVFAGKTGVWLVRSAPTRDELGLTRDLAYLEGRFEVVLEEAGKIHGFKDANMCGEILPIRPRRV
jgi:hypothetical protein